ncbi:MAG: DUF4115 domain-containing protein [Cyanobacteria bacterium]|nr:DUF4115 domain-containing protein [Cyanobacteriota bacterium]
MPDSPDDDRLRHEMLEEELEAARRKRDSYQALLKDLPEVFEGKFRERVRPVQQRNEQLLEEGMALREQIRRALPQAGVAGSASLPPATEFGASVDRGTALEKGLKDAGKPAGPAGVQGLTTAAESLRSTGMPGALAAGLALGLGGLLLATQPWRSGGGSRPTDRPAAPGMTTPSAQVPASTASPAIQSAPPPAGVPSISLRTTGPSWLEVRSTDGVVLFSGELNGQRSFPLSSGLMIRSGRADQVYLRVNGQPERKLGSIDWLDWTTFPPAPPAGTGASRQP